MSEEIARLRREVARMRNERDRGEALVKGMAKRLVRLRRCMRDRLVYIAGPYHNGGGTVEENVAIAKQAAIEYWNRGYAVICPHLNTHNFHEGGIPQQTLVEGDLEIVRRCDTIVMLPDWENSKGAKQEYEEAKRWRLRIEYYR